MQTQPNLPQDQAVVTASTRRPFAYRRLAAAGARFEALGDAVVAAGFGATAAEEAEAARTLALADLSPLPRTGFKGADAIAWLGRQGLVIGDASNRAYRQSDGTLAARLSPGEALILPPLNGDGSAIGRLAAAWQDDGQLCYPVPRRDSHGWLRILGDRAAEMMAKLCAVDLRARSFPDLAVAQTSVARLGAIVIRDDLGPCFGLHLLADSASADYLWRCLADAMGEYGGRPVGLAALTVLARHPTGALG